MAINSISNINLDDLASKLKSIANTASGGGAAPLNNGKTEFLDLLEKGIKEINTASQEADKASMDLASGKSSNIHETMLAVTKAELGFDMMVQMRNKIIEAYQEVMRMQV